MSEAYDFYQLGRARLREGMAAQATVPLEKARRLEPEVDRFVARQPAQRDALEDI